MKPQPITTYNPSFGILKGYRKTPYGEYTWGIYKNYKIEVYDAFEYQQKLQYVSNKVTLSWIKSKLKYIQDGIKRVTRSENHNITMARTTDS